MIDSEQNRPAPELGWPARLGIVIGLQAQVEAADPDGLLTGTVPRMPANEDDVAAFECEAGARLPEAYREFLLHANGWPGMYFSLDAFGLEELRGGGSAARARELLEAYDAEDVLEESGLEASDLLPVAAGQSSDLVAIIRGTRPDAGQVVWIDAGEEYDRFDDFAEFVDEIAGMLEQYIEEQPAP